MKICLLGQANSVFVERWALFFAEAGHEVHVISFRKASLPGVTVHFFPSLPLIGKLNYLVWTPAIRRLIRRLDPDIVHGHYISSYGLIAALSGVHPLILSAWGSDVLLVPKRSRVMKHLVQYAIDRADRVTSECATTTEHLEKEFGVPSEKISTFGWGIDVALFRKDYAREAADLRERLGIPPSAPLILSARSLAPVYDELTLVESMPGVLKKHPEAFFLFLSGHADPDYKGTAARRVDALGAGHRFRLVHGLLDHEQMAIHMKAADVLISIPISDSGSTALLEGMACGLIPVVSDLPTNRAVIRDGGNGFVTPVGDAVRLSETLSRVLTDLDGWKGKMSAKNRETVLAEQDWNRLAPRMAALYESLAGGQR